MYICNWQVQLRPSSNCDLCLSLILPAKEKVISLLVPALSLLVTTPSLSVTFLISVCLSSISVSPIVSLVSHCYISFSPCFIFVSSCSISASPCSNSVSLYYICVGMSPFHLWYILFHFYYSSRSLSTSYSISASPCSISKSRAWTMSSPNSV